MYPSRSTVILIDGAFVLKRLGGLDPYFKISDIMPHNEAKRKAVIAVKLISCYCRKHCWQKTGRGDGGKPVFTQFHLHRILFYDCPPLEKKMHRPMSKLIIERIEAVPHSGYTEPFLGMGGVFLRRKLQPKAEIVNDISDNVATLFRVLQRHYPYFIDFLKFRISSRTEFERLMKENPETLTDLEKAARFLYLQKTAFGGKAEGRNFAMVKERAARFNITKIEPMLADINERLAGVVIERLPWQAFIRRYDSPNMLFYLDPPYWGNEADYGKGLFSRADFSEMAEILNSIQGRFILSLNAVQGVRETFKGFSIEAVDNLYTLSDTGPKKVKELLISN